VCITSTILLLTFSSFQLDAQSRKDLENRRSQILEEINLTNKQLQKTTSSQQSELQRFNILQEQVKKREELLQNIKSDLTNVNTQIALNKKESAKLEKEVQNLQNEYAAIIRKTYKIKLGTDPLMLILSSENLNQAFQRWLYVNQIKRMRSAQGSMIRSKQELLQEKVVQLENYRKERQLLLSQELSQKEQITGELTEKEKLLQSLKKDEQQLRKTLKEKELQQKKLQDEIQRIIAAEIERQRKEAEARARAEEEKRRKEAEKTKGEPAITETPAPKVEAEKKPTIKPSLPVTPEVAKLSDDFGKNKGNLPWPVSKGSISKRFGTQPHPVINTLSVTNNGIDIRTEPNTPVKVVFKGKVLGKKFIPGHQYMVLVQHGKYYTIYSNLGTVTVKDGQEINAGELIGYASDTEEPTTEVHFEIWQEQQLQDPSLWLKR